MKFVALVSGGKDSIYAIHLATREQHHELIACIHLAAPNITSSAAAAAAAAAANVATTTIDDSDEPTEPHNLEKTVPQLDDDNEDEAEESYMYQSAGSNVVAYQIEQCLQVPCIVYQRTGRSIQTGLLYHDVSSGSSGSTATTTGTKDDHDEVEDMYHAIMLAKQLYPMIEGVCNGAILSNYQRNRIECIVCNRLQLYSLSYLWRKSNQSNVLYEMMTKGQIQAILIKTASPPGLIPNKHLNQIIDEYQLYPYFVSMHEKYDFNICGEGGEYESFVVNAAIFEHHHFIIDESRIVFDDIHDPTTIGTLQIMKYHTEPKQQLLPLQQQQSTNTAIVTINNVSLSSVSNSITTGSNTTTNNNITATATRRMLYHPTIGILQEQQNYYNDNKCKPHVRQVNGGLYSISEIKCPQRDYSVNNTTTMTTKIIQAEIRAIFVLLQSMLDSIASTAQDIVMVHVYLSNISYFSIVNDDYRNFFGIVLPPSRSTIDIGPILLPTISLSSSSDGNHPSPTTNNIQECHVMIDCLVQCGSGTYMRDYNYSSTGSNNNIKNTDNRIVSNIGNNDSRSGNDVNALYADAAIQNTFSKLRDVLHVQSISYWAPVCVGPYSQANTLRGCIHWCAGQIGLYPPTMKFQNPSSWTDQLEQAWTNMANVLDALDACCIPKNLLSCIVFISDDVFHFRSNEHAATGTTNDDSDNEWTELCNICTTQMIRNGNVIPGDIDGIFVDPEQTHRRNNNNNFDDVYEDEETRIEMEKNHIPVTDVTEDIGYQLCPVLVVSIPQMPVGALCEIEVVAASRRATNALQIQDYCTRSSSSRSLLSSSRNRANIPSSSITCGPQCKSDWDTGHDFYTGLLPDTNSVDFATTVASSTQPEQDSYGDNATTNITTPHNDFSIHSYFRCLGSRTTSCALVTASIHCCNDEIISLDQQQQQWDNATVDLSTILHSMIMALKTESHYDHENILHVRLYYINTSIDGTYIRQVLQSVLQESFPTTDVIPASTVIPVTDMGIIQPTRTSNETQSSIRTTAANPFLAIQSLSIDPIRTEQSVWIHEGRK